MTKREEFQQKMQAQLKEWQDELAKLQERADKASASVKAQIQEQIEELRHKRDATANKLDQLQTASDAAWDDLKSGLEASWKDLKSSLDRASSRFKAAS